MATSSNVYAEKTFAEHPVAMWLLDDPADYHNLISESVRDIPNNLDTDPESYLGWNVYGGTAEDGNNDSYSTPPFRDSYITKIVGDVPTQAIDTITLLTPNIINANDLDFSVGTVSVSCYAYSDILDTATQSVSIGIEYFDGTQIVSVEKKYLTVSYKRWMLLSETFDIPLTANPIRAFITYTVDNSGTTGEYNFYVNGFSFGQLSEEFSATSLGTESQPLPADINISYPLESVEAAAYGLSGDSGHYLLKGSILSAVNTSIPLVYGASNITSIKENIYNEDVVPSLIIPGKGFLNNLGKYNEYTVEFWARVNSDASVARKIFGPISSSDGLYVEDGFMTLVIGDNSASHFVGEWYRPMLINIRVIRNSATLVINGEEVASLNFITDNLSLPDEYTDGKSNDWLGFYGYSDVYPFEIDCVSLYTYQVPTLVAKRRYAYGQAVGSAENINAAFGGTTAFVDYSFANYAANYNYPDFAKWEQGTFDNLVTTQNYLSTPEYGLPNIFTGDKTLEQLYADNKVIQDKDYPFITFRPNSEWNNVPTYFNLDRMNILNSEVFGFCGVFKITDETDNNEILFKIYNKTNGNYFSVEKDVTGGEYTIDYYLMYNGVRTEFLSVPYELNEMVSIGVNIGKMAEYYGGNLATFFGNQSSLSMYFGGDETNKHTFTGNIYQAGLSTQKNAQPFVALCNENGTFPLDRAEDVLAHTSSYTLIVENSHNSYHLDIGISGTWQDYMPLSYFAKYITDENKDRIYSLDFLQVNIGYPAISSLIATTTEGSWTYQELYDTYNNASPVLTYKDLLNSEVTGWTNYTELKNKSATTYSYDTSKSFVRSYITFQYIQDGANNPSSFYTTTQAAQQSRIIDIASTDYDLTWDTTRFEVVDNTIIYPRKDVDFNDIAVVYDIEINIRGVLGKRIGIDKFQIASQALNHNLTNKVGTRYGVDMYPFKKSGYYFDYKGKNPFSIYKGSTPYLYLTRNSGVQVRGDLSSKNSRGLFIPINDKLSQDYSINSLQLWMRYDDDFFSEEAQPLFDISYRTTTGETDVINFYIQSTDKSNKRAKIFALNNGNKTAYADLIYYVNGNYVASPVISSKMWSSIGVSFLNPLEYNGFAGQISLTGNMVFNNISYFKTNDIANIQSILARSWNKVKVEAGEDGWQYWTDFSWFDVYAEGSFQVAGLSPATIYNAYIGTNKTVIDDGSMLDIIPDTTKSYSDISYTRTVKIPV